MKTVFIKTILLVAALALSTTGCSTITESLDAVTAAHPTLPLGTQVWVTNLTNHRSVALTVNDRGPFAKGRIIDVSRRAADRLGFRRAGTTRVRVEVIQAARG